MLNCRPLSGMSLLIPAVAVYIFGVQLVGKVNINFPGGSHRGESIELSTPLRTVAADRSSGCAYTRRGMQLVSRGTHKLFFSEEARSALYYDN